MLSRLFRRLGRKASVAVEFALLSTFLLLPLFGASLDMVQFLCAKAQLNTALQALYYYALTYDPGTGSTLADPTITVSSANLSGFVSLMSSNIDPLALSSSSVTYDCINNNATTVTYSATSPVNTGGTIVNGTLTYGTNNGCTPSQTQRTTVSFTVSTSVAFIVPMPFISSNPLKITSTGNVQIH